MEDNFPWEIFHQNAIKLSQCYITPHINPVNALLQNLQPVVKSESHKCLLVIAKGIFEFFFPDGLCSVCSTIIF